MRQRSNKTAIVGPTLAITCSARLVDVVRNDLKVVFKNPVYVCKAAFLAAVTKVQYFGNNAQTSGMPGEPFEIRFGGNRKIIVDDGIHFNRFEGKVSTLSCYQDIGGTA
jgi:hypothetical protein